MSTSPSLDRFRTETADVPAAARARVWNRLQAEAARRPSRGWAFALAGTVAAAAIAVALRPAPPLVPLRGRGFVALPFDRDTQLEQRADALILQQGGVSISSWGPVSLQSGTHRVSADSAVFAVRAAGEQILVSVDQGSVQLDDERVVAGARGGVDGADFRAVRALEPASAAAERAWSAAEAAEADGRIDEAVSRFTALAQGSSLRAEAALLRKAQLELWSLRRPELALATLGEAARRFPNGALRQEAALFELEALIAQHDWHGADARAHAFVERYPDSERQPEVELAAAVAAIQLGDPTTGCRHLAAIDPARLSPEQRETAASLSSTCRSFER